MRRLRFSVFDLFVVTLGVAAGLAYHRLPGVRWTDALLVMCATWIVVGMAQQTRSAYLVWRSVPSADGELRNGAALAVARPIAVVAMLAAAVGFEVASQSESTTYDWPLDAFTAPLISLAIICAYTSPRRRAELNIPRGKTRTSGWLDVVALVFGAGLLLHILVSEETISGLIHIAVRGVENAQPTRWAGKPFYHFDPQVKLAHDFFWGSVIATSAASVSAISTLLLTVHWDRRMVRRLLIAAATIGVAFAAYLLHWCWTVAYPSLSPYLAQNTGKQPWYIVAGGITVAAGACFLFVIRYVPQPRSSQSGDLTIPNSYHFTGTIMSLLLVAMIVGGAPAWWWESMSLLGVVFGYSVPPNQLQSWWDSGARLTELPMVLLQFVLGSVIYWLEEPKMLLRLAAILVVGNQLFGLRRGELGEETLTRVKSAKLVTVSLFAAATLLVAVPAGAWLGFAIVTTTFAGL